MAVRCAGKCLRGGRFRNRAWALTSDRFRREQHYRQRASCETCSAACEKSVESSVAHSKPPNKNIARSGTAHPVGLGLACGRLLFDRRANITRGHDAIRVGTNTSEGIMYDDTRLDHPAVSTDMSLQNRSTRKCSSTDLS